MLASVPHFDQWLGVWAIREEDFRAGYQWFMGLDLHLHLQTAPSQAARQASEEQRPDIRDGVELIGIYGSLQKQQASLSRSTSTVMTRRKIRAAVRNPDVAAILLHVESPGGTAAGTKELADDVAAAAKQKPVWAFIEDLGASAAYWIASQATHVYANPTAIVGSIGTYGVVYDYSAMAAKEGIKVHVIRAGDFKGAFTPGTEVTAEQLTEQQKIVTELNEFFIRGVKAGRKLSLEAARQLADGRVHVGQAAVERQLIDGVQSLDDTFSQLAAYGRKRRSSMSLETAAEAALTPQASTDAAVTTAATAAAQILPFAAEAKPASRPATLAELKAACPGATNDFLVSQLEANATAAQASAAWMAKLAADNARLSQENASLKDAKPAEQAAPAGKGPGADPVGAGVEGNQTTGDALSQFEQAVAEEIEQTKKPRHEAVQAVCRRDPQMREAMVAAHNAKHSKARQRRA
jgi:signal peptide peptidase SppA